MKNKKTKEAKTTEPSAPEIAAPQTPPTETEPVTVQAPAEKSNPLPMIALITGLVGFVFSFASGTFILVLALLLCLAALIMGAISVKTKKVMAISTIVLSVIGLLFSVTGFSRGSKNEAKNNTASQPTVNINANTAAVSNTTAQNVALPNNFSKKELGYSIGYPQDWTYTDQDKSTVVFSAAKGSADQGIIFEIQNILFKSQGGSYENLDDGIKQLKDQVLTNDKNAKIGEAIDVSLDGSDGSKLSGKGVDIEMNVGGIPYKGAMTLIAYPQGKIFFLVEYYGPKEKFKQATDIAVSMINSWKIGQ